MDLERRKVVDVLKGRSVEATTNWLKQRPEIEFVVVALDALLASVIESVVFF